MTIQEFNIFIDLTGEQPTLDDLTFREKEEIIDGKINQEISQGECN